LLIFLIESFIEWKLSDSLGVFGFVDYLLIKTNN
jgi:hypothetical protein